MRRFHQSNNVKQTGFTLLELLMVVSILSSVAYLAIDNIASSDAQNKWELTDIRLQTMRRAIIGDSRRSLNGKSELSGFVVDMGRLPGCVAELLAAESCSGEVLPEYTLFDNNQAGGWNGPYLKATHLTNGAAFRDAWGNKSNTNIDDEMYFGWEYKVIDSPLDQNHQAVMVQSLGLDGNKNPLLSDDYGKLSFYERDYPPTLHTGDDYSADPLPLIRTNQYRQPVTQYNEVSLNYSGALWLDLGVLSACENAGGEFDAGACDPVVVDAFFETVCLKISSVEDGLLNENALISREAVTLTLDGTRQLLAFQFGDATDAYLLQGRHVASLKLWESGSCTNNTVDFNASFDSVSDGGISDDDVLEISFVVLPGVMLDILDGHSNGV